MPSCHFVHLILLSSGPKVPKSGPFKNEGIYEVGDSGYPYEVCEAALAHQVGNAVSRSYRRGDGLEQRRVLMEAWAAFISSS